MWLFILAVVLVVTGLIGMFAFTGILGIAFLVAGAALVGLKILRDPAGPFARPDPHDALGVGDPPEDAEHAPRAHTKTGYAHPGQEHMVP